MRILRLSQRSKKAAALGTSYGAPCPQEVELARLVTEMMPSIEVVRFVNSGTEATMSALRLARLYRSHEDRQISGQLPRPCRHAARPGRSGVATLGLPDSPGVPAATVADTLTARYNDLDSAARLFDSFAQDIAAVIVEPVAGNMGMVPPAPGFLAGLRDLTAAHDALLIFDEVMTGFRVHPGGAQMLFDITPDITALGKVIGGGLPVGAYGGRRDIMELVAPAGPMYQAGTLSGNPLAMTAGAVTLRAIRQPDVWERLERTGEMLVAGLGQAARQAGIAVSLARLGTMFGLFFAEGPVIDWDSAKIADTNRFARYFRAMLEQGVYLAPRSSKPASSSTAQRRGGDRRDSRRAERAFAQL